MSPEELISVLKALSTEEKEVIERATSMSLLEFNELLSGLTELFTEEEHDIDEETLSPEDLISAFKALSTEDKDVIESKTSLSLLQFNELLSGLIELFSEEHDIDEDSEKLTADKS
ncbi:hypothetical protein ACLB2K_058098 [Fragaria x ananassa]